MTRPGRRGRSTSGKDGNRDRRFHPEERGDLVSRVGPGGAVASIDAGLEPPRTSEVLVGIENRFGGTWVVRFLGIHREANDLVESVNVGVPLSSYTVRTLPDPGVDFDGTTTFQSLPVYDRDPKSFGQDRYVLTNPPEHRTLHEGWEATIEKTHGRFRMLLAGTASRTRGRGANRGFHVFENDPGVVGELFDEPNADTQARGHLFFDRSYTLKFSGSYRAPGDLRVGVVARYQDGQPFSRLVVVRDLHQGPTAVQTFARGLSRFTYTLTLDARVEKGFRVGHARAAVVAQVFNLLDTANEVEENVVTAPDFRAPTAVQPPRVLRLGLRLDF